MKVGIVGQGLIGGSMAKAYASAGHEVYGSDTDGAVLGWAKLSGMIADELTDAGLCAGGLILLAAAPGAAVRWLTEHSPEITPDTLVMDLCGAKRQICEAGFRLAEQYGYTFAGGHPMAGSHLSGLKHTRAELFLENRDNLIPEIDRLTAELNRFRNALAASDRGELTALLREGRTAREMAD